VTVTVKRSLGSDGHVDIEYRTKDGTATAEHDYTETIGVLPFEHGELEKTFFIPIKPTARYQDDLTFTVELLEPKGYGVKLGRITIATITLTNDEKFKAMVDKFASMMKENVEKFEVGTHTWKEQFKAALSVPEPDDPEEEPSRSDYILHVLAFYWKFLMAFIPPTHVWGGWAAFLVSLTFTGVMTAMVGDLAGMFGCIIGLKKTVTAITFIALGTSIPDTFASKLAA
jgi:solute carrier family 8 (sodium/calcium exchanger)